MNRISGPVRTSCLMALLLLNMACAERVDLLVINANIYTVDDDRPLAEAFAVDEGRFVAVGNTEEIVSRFAGQHVLDAKGQVVIPGLIDSHGHLVNHGLVQMNVDLRGTTSISDMIERLRVRASSLPNGEWLRGRGWDQNDWEDKRFPSRRDLDAVFPDRPVWLERIDGHASVLNSSAMAEMGIDSNGISPDPPGGRIVRDERGVPTGLLIDAASDQVERVAPPPSRELLRQGILMAMADAASVGLTGIHEAGIRQDTLELFRQLVDEGVVTLRLYAMTEALGEAFRRVCDGGPVLGYGNVLTVRAVKLYADGALGSRGAALLEDYSDDPGNNGLMRKSAADLRQSVGRVVSCGLQPAVHAIGDSANRIVLDIYEDLSTDHDLEAIRPRIEHAQILHPDDLPRFGRLGIIAAMQPTHATSDMYWAEDRLGGDRLHGAYAWKTLASSGAYVPFGSDFPVESIDPRLGLYAAVTRQDLSGYPAGGWLPTERVSIDAALRGFTIEAARAAFMEDDAGSIEPGKFADFVILGSDIMSIPAPEIPDVEIVATYLGGKQVYRELR